MFALECAIRNAQKTLAVLIISRYISFREQYKYYGEKYCNIIRRQ
jgi:hypothetical protein